MNMTPRFKCLPLVLAITTTPALYPEELNVSPIATAGRNLSWTEEAAAPRVRGGAVYTFFQMGRARVEGDLNDYFAIGPWSAAWQNSPAYPALSREVPTPAATPQLTWASPYYREAKIDMESFPKRVASHTFSSGWAKSAVNYSVRVAHYSATALDYFVLLKHPKYLRGIQFAYTLQPNSSGGVYLYKSPTSARARAAVDVLVDGLPVWSSESTYMYRPDGTINQSTDKRETTWGNTVTANGETKLYLGKLSAGKSITITFVVRTDAHADADECGTEYGGWNTPNKKRCFDLTQTVELTSNTTGPVSFSVYGKDLNTTPMPVTIPIYWDLF
jgi:hypothetical protein